MFDYSDYRILSEHEHWFNYDKEHKPIRDFCEKIVNGNKFGLVYNSEINNYFMTLSRNHDNLIADWRDRIESNGGEYVGEAFCGALLVYFTLPQN